MFDSFGKRNPRKMPIWLFSGALRLDYASAVRADISKQNFGLCPRHWYLDATFLCARCDKIFVFTVDEQRLWYEELGFWIDSIAKHCTGCRGELRDFKALRNEYDRHIAQALSRDAPTDKKCRLISLIDALETGGIGLPEQIRQNRQALSNQIERLFRAKID